MRNHRIWINHRIMAGIISITLLTTGCAKVPEEKGTVTELFGGPYNEIGNVEAPTDFDWRQCEGTILNFICEDNINANILSKETERFTETTGIKVNIKRMDFNTLEEKINMEFISKTAQYDLIYVDPYRTLNRFCDGLEDLNQYENDPALPHIVGGIGSFDKDQLEICSYFSNTEQLYAIPFDSTTMILFYRKDILEQYKEQMKTELGFEPDPENGTFSWDQYIAVAEWIDKNVDKSVIKYGSITMSARHNSIYTAFSTVLGAYGGNYFANEKVTSLGSDTSSNILSKTAEFKAALEEFKKLTAINPRNNLGYTWDEAANAFTNGEAAMMMNWDENVSAIENSPVAGKVGYSILPKGSVRSSNIYGGSGIGINSYAGSKRKLAAWLFIVWATSPEVQMRSFTEKDGGTLPTRTALKKLIFEKYADEQPQVTAMYQSQLPEYAYFRPKMRNGDEFENIIIDNLFEMNQKDLNVNSVAIGIKSQWH